MRISHLFAATAAAVLLALGGTAQAGVVRFDNPAVIDIYAAGLASYTEAGFTFTAQAADFLLLDDGAGNGFIVGGFLGAGPITLRAASGSPFGLASLDFGYFDLGDTPGQLAITGLLNGQTVATQTLALGAWAGTTFDSPWATLSEVRFSATSGFVLDNIAAVPEPGTVTLLGLGLAGLLASRRMKQAR